MTTSAATELTFEVADLPPAKNEAKSMFAEGHPHSGRVLALLRAARGAAGTSPRPLFGGSTIGLEVTVTAPIEPPSDATNYLGGIGDVLEAKTRRGALGHLEELAKVALYDNDRQIHEVHYRWQRGAPTGYRVRIWRL